MRLAHLLQEVNRKRRPSLWPPAAVVLLPLNAFATAHPVITHVKLVQRNDAKRHAALHAAARAIRDDIAHFVHVFKMRWEKRIAMHSGTANVAVCCG